MRRVLQGIQRSRCTTVPREVQSSEFVSRDPPPQLRLQPPLHLPPQLQLRGLFGSVHPALWRTAKPPSPSGISRGPRNEPSHALLPEPPSPGRCPHHDPRANWSREIIPSELPHHQP